MYLSIYLQILTTFGMVGDVPLVRWLQGVALNSSGSSVSSTCARLQNSRVPEVFEDGTRACAARSTPG